MTPYRSSGGPDVDELRDAAEDQLREDALQWTKWEPPAVMDSLCSALASLGMARVLRILDDVFGPLMELWMGGQPVQLGALVVRAHWARRLAAAAAAAAPAPPATTATAALAPAGAAVLAGVEQGTRVLDADAEDAGLVDDERDAARHVLRLGPPSR